MSDSSYSKLEEKKGRAATSGRPKKPAAQDENRAKRLGQKLDGVKDTMKDNIEAALERGDKLNVLEAQTNELEGTAKSFKKTTTEVKHMFQWKAFLWQLGFAAVILLILACVTLYILSATGILNGRGSSSSPSTASNTIKGTTVVAPATIADDDKRLAAEGEPCSLDPSGTDQCAADLKCMAKGKGYVGTGGSEKDDGVCRRPTTATKGDAEAKSTEQDCASRGAGWVLCTTALVNTGYTCVIGECVTAPESASSSAAAAAAATTEIKDSSSEPSTDSKPQTDSSASSDSTPKATPETKSQTAADAATPQLTAGARIYNVLPGESPNATEAEIVEALTTIHKHAAGCVAGILHKDCTLDVLLKSWGVGGAAI